MIGSLFSGIGGLELGLEWAGLGPVSWQVEIDPWCRSVLARHWPAADRSVVDVREAGRARLPYCEVICGGKRQQNQGARIKALGNAVVPQAAEIVGRIIRSSRE